MSAPRKKIDRNLKNTEKLAPESEVMREAKQTAEETRSNAKETEKLKVAYDTQIIEYKKLQSRIEDFEKKFGEKLNLKDYIAENGKSYSLVNPEMHDLLDYYLTFTYNGGFKLSDKHYSKEQMMEEIRSLNFENFVKFVSKFEKFTDYKKRLGSDKVSIAKYEKSWELIESLQGKMVTLKVFGDNIATLINEFTHPKIKEAATTFITNEQELVKELQEIIPVIFQAKNAANEIYQMSHPAVIKAIEQDKFKCEGDEVNGNIKVITDLAGEENNDAPLVITASSDSYFYFTHGTRQCEFKNLLRNKKVEAYGKYIASFTKVLIECSKLRVSESNRNYDEQSKAVSSTSTAVSTITVKDQHMCDVLDVKMLNMLNNLSTFYSYGTKADADIAEKLESMDYFINFDGEGTPTIGSEDLNSKSSENEGSHKDFKESFEVFEAVVEKATGSIDGVTQLLAGVDRDQLMIASNQDNLEEANVPSCLSVDSEDASCMGQNTTMASM